MKKIYSLIALVALSSVAIAQTVKVTFRVNMQNVAVGPKGLHIAGDLQADAGIGSNWSPGATGNTLTATGSGYVYSIQLTLKASTTYSYKYVNGDAWSFPNESFDRKITTGTSDQVVDVYCWDATSDCAAPPTGTQRVVFQVEMKNEDVSADGVRVAGNYQKAAGMAGDWNPGNDTAKCTQVGTVYTLVKFVPNGSYNFKYVNGKSGWESLASDRAFTVSGAGVVNPLNCFGKTDTCATIPKYKRDITFMVVDGNYQNSFKLTNVKFKGNFSSWSDFVANDSGVRGDVKANDGIWTAKYPQVNTGSYEWGATAGADGHWIIKGPNRTFKLNYTDGSVVGDTVYTIPKLGSLLNVTFSVDMSDTIVSADGVWLAGNFQPYMDTAQTEWKFNKIKLKDMGNGIWSVTLKIWAQKYQFRFANGLSATGDDSYSEKNLKAACGELNGYNKYDRVFDIATATADVKLPVYKWNSCTALSNRNVIEAAEVSIAPNPAERMFVVRLESSKISQITVSGIDGRVVRTLNSNSNVETVEVSGLMGIYFVNITDQFGRTTTQKVVLK
jgi:hypothetical protein